MMDQSSLGYVFEVCKAFGRIDDEIPKIMTEIASALKSIYNFIEPSHFKGQLYLFRTLDDSLVFDNGTGSLLHDQSVLLHRTEGNLFIQLNARGLLTMWRDQDESALIKFPTALTYRLKNKKECFLAKEKEIPIDYYEDGSLYANQFGELQKQLRTYAQLMIYQSTCETFSESWSDVNRLFFKGGGSGSDIPEKFMQYSLHNFLRISFAVGTKIEVAREHNVSGLKKPKPIDIKLRWLDSNRIALIEIKFLGTIKTRSGKKIKKVDKKTKTRTYSDSRANAGMKQLKGYHDSAVADSPNAIIKSFLVVIDGRRGNLKTHKKTINASDGLYFKDKELNIIPARRYFDGVPGISPPVRMFSSPIIM